MNIGELKELIKDLDDDLEVSITLDDNSFVNACICSSGVDEIEFEDSKEFVFILAPCQDVMVDILIEDAEDKLYQISEN